MVKVAIIGNSGHAATVTRALPRLGNDIEIVGFCHAWDGEPMAEVLEDFAKYGLTPKEYPDYHTLLDEVEADIIVVDGMFCDHAQMTIDALTRGFHVYCDKPLALNEEDLKRVEDAAANCPGTLWAMQTSRYDAWFYTAKQLIDRGAVGEIRALQAQKSYRLGTRAPFFRSRAQHGGLIPWVAIHGLDFIRYLCDKKIKTVYAAHSTIGNQGNGELEVTSQCQFTMEDGVIAQISADYLRPANAATHGDDRVRVAGTKGVLEVRDDKVWLINDEFDGTVPMPIEEPPMIFEDFVRTVEGKGSGLLDAAESFADTRIALAARESADTGVVQTLD